MAKEFPKNTLILNTRSAPQANELTNALRALAAEVLEIPALEIEILPPTNETVEAIFRLAPEDFLALTSSNAVKALAGFPPEVLQKLSQIQIVVVGEATAASVKSLGLTPKLVSKIPSASGLGEELVKCIEESASNVLFLKGDSAGNDLERALQPSNIKLNEIVVYRSREAQDLRQRIESSSSHLARLTASCFMSGNAAHAFVNRTPSELLPLLREKLCVAVGPNTALVLEELQFSKIALPRTPTSNSVIEVLLQLVG